MIIMVAKVYDIDEYDVTHWHATIIIFFQLPTNSKL